MAKERERDESRSTDVNMLGYRMYVMEIMYRGSIVLGVTVI
jgi:hypothetical protein